MTIASFINETLWSVWAVPVFAYFLWLSVVLSIIDLRELRLPNKYVYSAYAVIAGGLMIVAAISNLWSTFFEALMCGLVGLAFFMILHLLYSSGLGMGDVKLAGIVGLIAGWVSWGTAIVALMLTFVLSALVSIGLLLSRKATLKSALPFGPFMLGGTILAIAITAILRAQFA